MSIWFFLWILISVGLLGFTAWTFWVLRVQKKAWRAFAKKYKMRYTPGSMMESPSINGLIDGYTVGVFSDLHASPDQQRARRLSAIEITLHSSLGVDAAFASGAMVPIVQDLSFKTELKPAHSGWKDEYIAITSQKSFMDTYLTPQRLSALIGLMEVKNGSVIFISRPEIMLLRFDTPEPFDTPQKLNRVVKQMLETVKALEYDGVKAVQDDVESDDPPSQSSEPQDDENNI